MIPSDRWFPTSLQDRSAWYQNFVTQFSPVAVSLGFVAADVTAIGLDSAVFQWLADQTVTVDNFRRAVVEYRVNLTEGNIGDPQPIYPGQNFDNPPSLLEAGMFERLNKLRNRILAAPAYSDDLGILLGIVGDGGGVGISESEVKPEIQCTPAATGYMFSIVVSKRYDADSWQVWATPAGVTDWKILATATGKSADVVVSPTGEVPAPIQLQVRVQLRRSNENYGEPSDIAQVTVNP
jgi:hypothetical protein